MENLVDKKNDKNKYVDDFTEIVSIIEKAKNKIYKIVNSGLIDMYWEIGEYINHKVAENRWGENTIIEFSIFVQTRFQNIKGFSPQNIWRMRQFFETYRDNPKLSPLVREITWSNNLLIMAGAKTDEDRKDDTVVEYALSHTLTPTLISEYTLKLPDKKLLQEKLAEITDFSDMKDE